MSDIVKIADSGHVRTIALNRPDRKNALNNALAWGVVAAVEDAKEARKAFLEKRTPVFKGK